MFLASFKLTPLSKMAKKVSLPVPTTMRLCDVAITCSLIEINKQLNKAGYTANKQSLVGGQGQYTQGQGQSIIGQGLNFWVGRGCYAQKS